MQFDPDVIQRGILATWRNQNIDRIKLPELVSYAGEAQSNPEASTPGLRIVFDGQTGEIYLAGANRLNSIVTGELLTQRTPIADEFQFFFDQYKGYPFVAKFYTSSSNYLPSDDARLGVTLPPLADIDAFFNYPALQITGVIGEYRNQDKSTVWINDFDNTRMTLKPKFVLDGAKAIPTNFLDFSDKIIPIMATDNGTAIALNNPNTPLIDAIFPMIIINESYIVTEYGRTDSDGVNQIDFEGNPTTELNLPIFSYNPEYTNSVSCIVNEAISEQPIIDNTDGSVIQNGGLTVSVTVNDRDKFLGVGEDSLKPYIPQGSIKPVMIDGVQFFVSSIEELEDSTLNVTISTVT